MKLFNSIERPLGVNSYTPERKEWIATAIGAGAGLLSSFIGGSHASKAAKEAERRQRQQEAKENAWYNRRYNEDYLDTAAGQNLVRRAKDYAKEQWKKASGAQAVAGGTAASTQMAKDAGNKMVGDTMANIAATDQARKAQVDNMHRQAESEFAQMDMQREMNRAQNITNAAQQASNAMIAAGSAVDQMNAAKVDLNGGGNNGSPIDQNTASAAYNQAKIDAAKNNIGNDPMSQSMKAANDEAILRSLKPKNNIG